MRSTRKQWEPSPWFVRIKPVHWLKTSCKCTSLIFTASKMAVFCRRWYQHTHCRKEESALTQPLSSRKSTTGEKPKGVGNPTEVALLLWLNKQGKIIWNFARKHRSSTNLTFSTERKFMATLVDSPLIGKKILYIKGAPEIVLGKCKEVVLTDDEWTP